MYKVTKKDLKIIGELYPDLVQLQVEDYFPTNFRVIIINANQIIEEEDE